MFDMLTHDQLFDLHDSLFAEATRTHQRMVAADGTALISPFSDEWAVLSARHAEISETQQAVTAELHRRDEEARADA